MSEQHLQLNEDEKKKLVDACEVLAQFHRVNQQAAVSEFYGRRVDLYVVSSEEMRTKFRRLLMRARREQKLKPVGPIKLPPADYRP